MLSPKEFVERWTLSGDILVQYTPEMLESTNLPAETKQFLIEAGLPDSAAPFLSFEAPKKGQISTLTNEWGLPEEFNMNSFKLFLRENVRIPKNCF